MKRQYLSVAVLTALLAGCSQYYQPVPVETIRPLSNQLDMQAAHHWERLAEQVASNIQANLPNQPGTLSGMSAPAPVEPMAMAASGSDPLTDLPPGTLPPPGPQPEQQPRVVHLDMDAPVLTIPPMPESNYSAPTPSFSAPVRPVIYINPPRGGQETLFAHSFGDLLRAHLVQKGVAVSTNPGSVNSFCTQASYCKPLVLDYNVELVQHKDRWRVRESSSEVLISTALTDGDLVVFSRSDIFYIRPGDGDHYDHGRTTLRVVDQ
ncbi:hypothetical protein [Candidatus Venteria ishoeyi]|uniref:Uncharacterized protein n=1 Tax=Candidatus Venteria ishoeyi TaxID=1899563 RepID=A0A1H6FFN5_9GAMM|nr:hypothetical protein [Candidatus Venteria ishoeyi]MDM8545544.1 hypothetical protein [Candidatus Venteria ishoeyi]SEH08880.1 Uncharacterised protein [Candidatus Venteria ishoeyi]